MKSIISISFLFGLLISHAFGSNADLMEGALGERESAVSFFEAEVNKAFANLGQVLIELKSDINKSEKSMGVGQQVLVLNRAQEAVISLHGLLHQLNKSKNDAKRMRALLETISEGDEDNLAEE